MATRKYTYPWRTKNEFTLLVNGENFYPDIIHEVEHATQSIYIIQYMVSSGNITNKILAALISAANRGVKIYIILDAYGAKELSLLDYNKLLQAKISLVSFNAFRLKKLLKFLYRDHRKLVIIDDKIAYTGGAGIADEVDTQQNSDYGWQDIMLKMQGDIIADWYQTFAQSWVALTATNLPPCRGITTDHFTRSGRLNIAYRRTQEVVRSISNNMQQARQRICIVTPYFVTTWKIRRKMRKAGKRGVDVKLIVPGPHSDHPWVNHISRHYYTRLLKSNVQIYEYQPRFLHTKLVICDDWVNVGSCNLDRWNMRFNRDANIEIHAETIIGQFNTYIEELIANSQLIDASTWQQRPLKERLKEWFWSKVALWIERLTQNTR